MPLPALPALDISMDVSLPKGDPAHFISAVERLAPHQGVWVKGDGTRQPLSRVIAEEAVEGVARMYNTNRYLEKKAPRRGAVLKKIDKLKRHLDFVARELSGMDELVARIIYGEALRRSKQPDRLRIFEAADVQGLQKNGASQSAWGDRVARLSQTLGILAAELPSEWERQGYALKDKGCKQNHFTETEGTANWRLRTDALEIYNAFKPGKATGTAEGDLHHFVNEIFEYATGRETNDGIIRPLRDIVRPTREENQIHARNDEIFNELENMAPGKTIEFLTRAELKKMSELHAELDRNRARSAELSKVTWPHAPMSAL